MASTTEHITGTTVNRVLRQVADGRRDFEVRDKTVGGLSIRVRADSANWSLRTRVSGKQTTLRIAALAAMRDPVKVRELAERGKAMAKDGQDPTPFFEAARIEGSGEAKAAEVEATKRAGTVWTWEQARDAFIEDTNTGSKKHTHRSYKSVLNQPDFDVMKGRLVTELTANDLRAVRRSMIKRGVPTQAKSAVRTAKAMMSWVVEHDESGIDVSPFLGVNQTPRKKSERAPEREPSDEEGAERQRKHGGRPLTELQLGRLIWAVDEDDNAAARLATMFTLLTLQRRFTIVQAEKDTFKEDPATGYLVWTIPPWATKSEREHTLPLPPLARDVHESARLLSKPSSKWLFPKLRRWRSTDVGDKHMDEGTINKLLYRCQKKRNLLARHEDGSFVSPHDVRSTFTTILQDEGVPETQSAKVLAHSEGKGQTVTSRHYDYAKELRLKMGMLTRWEEYVLEMKAKHAPDKAQEAAD